jgi:hypothetical protein
VRQELGDEGVMSAQQRPKRRAHLVGSGAGRSTTTASHEQGVRYARSEPTREQYQQQRADLQGPEA